MITVIDLFAGIGGWDLAHDHHTVGVEFSNHACTTREAAGLDTMWDGDVRDLIPAAFNGEIQGVTASPPCQAFSQATKGAGIDDERGALVYVPLEWALQAQPDWMCLEQVRGARPHFENIAAALISQGWSAEVKLVNAADHGLPQARKRVLLAARRDGVAIKWPDPTHAWRGENGLPPWVSMADGLKAGGVYTHNLPDWCYRRPATTIVGSFRPEVIAAPGWRKHGDKPRQDTPDSPRMSIEQRLVLQGFPADWPVQGPKTARDLQVGNAIPPVLARVALEAAGAV